MIFTLRNLPKDIQVQTHEFCVIPDLKSNIQQCLESMRLAQAKTTSGGISGQLKKSFELMLLSN